MKLDKRLLRQAASVPADLGLTIGVGLLASAVLVAQAHFLSRVVNRVFLEGSPLGAVQPLLLALLILGLARAGLSWVGEVAASRAAARIKAELRQRLSSHLLALGPASMRGEHSKRSERSGELINTAVEGVEALDAYFSQYLPQLALSALVPLFILIFVLRLDLISGLVLLLTAPLIPVFLILIGSAADSLTRRQWTALSHMSAHFLDVLQGLTTLRLLGRSRQETQLIAHVSDRFRETTLGVLRVAFLSALVMEMVATISTAIVAVEIGLRLLYGNLAFEQAFFILLLAPEFYLPLRLLGARFHAGAAGLAAAQRIFEVLDRQEPVPSTSSSVGRLEDWNIGRLESSRQSSSLPAIQSSSHPIFQPSNSQLHLRFEDVHYAYEAGRRPALNGLSLDIAPGQTVALVGPSGGGKSTVAALLLRFVQPDRGMISVDGVPLPSFPAHAWRRQVAWVPQNPYLFHGTLAENIALARPEASLDEVAQAARQAGAHDFIQALPLGYATPVGERGARLSGGQAQRIALARAFLKDAPLLILDEPTSHLDPEHEAWLLEAMTRLTQGRTVLVIAHRLSTVYRADRIYVLAGGQVVESGTHAALMEQGGLYRKLVGKIGRLENWKIGRLEDWKTGRLARPGCASRAGEDWEPEDDAQPSNHPIFQSSTLPAFQPSHHPTIQSPNLPISQSPNLPPLLRLLQFAAPFKARMALAALLGFATVGSGIGLMATSAYIIAQAALHPSIAALQVAIAGVRFFGIARGVFRYLERYVSHQVTFHLLARLRVWFYERLEPLAPARLIHYRSGDILSRIVADIETLQHVYVRVLAPPLVAILVAALMAFFMGRYHARLAATLLAFLALAGVGLPLFTSVLSRGLGRRMVAARAELNAALVDGVQGVADLLAFGGEARHQERVEALSQELSDLQKRMAGIGGLHASVAGLLMNLATLATLVVAIPLVTAGRLNGVSLAVLALAVIASFEAVLPLPAALQYLGNSLAAARRLFEIVDVQPAVSDPPSPSPAPQDYSLSVEDLRFGYQSGEPPALDGVSFHLAQGATLAVVGPSGSGKTTLVNMLLRFWEYDAGHIMLGGHPLRAYRQEDLRAMMGVVSQHTHLFNASVRDNLLVARPAASQADLLRAAQAAHIHEFIQSLPEGYDTWIGEQGLRLSGGQRQRLAIARALLKDAPILILDEPTANLDTLTERGVMQGVRTLMAGRTTLLTTHRLVGLEDVDEILVLQAGRVVERGRHAELLSAGGLYQRMWNLQGQILEEAAHGQ